MKDFLVQLKRHRSRDLNNKTLFALIRRKDRVGKSNLKKETAQVNAIRCIHNKALYFKEFS